MTWKQNSAETIERLEGALRPFPCLKRQMFGCPVYCAADAMFAGVHDDRIFLRLSAQDRQMFRAGMEEARPFEPLPGRIMREYVVVPSDVDDTTLQFWLALSHGYASSLPPRPAGKKRGKG